MSELKRCPFCGSEAITTTFIDPDDFEYMPIEVNDCDAEVTCENEHCINGWYLSPKDWNTRPIEDALQASIAELEAENERLGFMAENQSQRYTRLFESTDKLSKLLRDYRARIAELEAAQRWIPVSERLPEEDTDGNTLMAICRHSGEWVRAPFGAEFADEFVRHYSYWMYAPQPPEVQE